MSDILEQLASILQRNGDYRILRRLPFIYGAGDLPDDVKRAVVIDTETTSLDTAACKVIEIAVLELFFDNQDNIIGSGSSYDGLEDPGELLSEETKRVTGLTDADVEGKRSIGSVYRASLKPPT